MLENKTIIEERTKNLAKHFYFIERVFCYKGKQTSFDILHNEGRLPYILAEKQRNPGKPGATLQYHGLKPGA